MLLGLSSASVGTTVDFSAVNNGGENGVRDGDLLVRFSQTAASLESTERALADARDEMIGGLGEAGFVEAAATVANFTMMTRIADGTGTPLDPGSVDPSTPMRDAMNLDELVSARW